MSIHANSIDVYGIKTDLIKRGEKKALQLIKCYEEALARQQELTQVCLSKIRDQAQKIRELEKR